MLIREKSPKNNEMLQTWKVLKTISHNISFILFIFSLLLILKIVFYKVTSVLILLAIIVFCIVNSAILMHRAWIFEDWYYNDLIVTAKAFQFGNLKLNKER